MDISLYQRSILSREGREGLEWTSFSNLVRQEMPALSWFWKMYILPDPSLSYQSTLHSDYSGSRVCHCKIPALHCWLHDYNKHPTYHHQLNTQSRSHPATRNLVFHAAVHPAQHGPWYRLDFSVFQPVFHSSQSAALHSLAGHSKHSHSLCLLSGVDPR